MLVFRSKSSKWQIRLRVLLFNNAVQAHSRRESFWMRNETMNAEILTSEGIHVSPPLFFLLFQHLVSFRWVLAECEGFGRHSGSVLPAGAETAAETRLGQRGCQRHRLAVYESLWQVKTPQSLITSLQRRGLCTLKSFLPSVFFFFFKGNSQKNWQRKTIPSETTLQPSGNTMHLDHHWKQMSSSTAWPPPTLQQAAVRTLRVQHRAFTWAAFISSWSFYRSLSWEKEPRNSNQSSLMKDLGSWQHAVAWTHTDKAQLFKHHLVKDSHETWERLS